MVAAFALFLVPVAAIAAGGFTDVDDDSVFLADIQWMKDNGVTKGCNPPTNDRFCPSSNVTREQMSAFMHRLAVNKVVDAKTAVEADHAMTADSATSAVKADTAVEADNADTLDGTALEDIAPIVWSQTDGNTAGVTSSGTTQLNSIAIDVPSSGFISISGSVWINPTGAGITSIATKVDGTIVAPSTGTFTTREETGGSLDYSMSYTVTVPITAGAHTVSQDLIGTMSYFHNKEYFTVLFVPMGSHESVSSPASAQSGGSETGE
jgi:hypothetical protein